MGAGFKNWRPVRLVGARRRDDGTYTGGHIVAAARMRTSRIIRIEQFYGNGRGPRGPRLERRPLHPRRRAGRLLRLYARQVGRRHAAIRPVAKCATWSTPTATTSTTAPKPWIWRSRPAWPEPQEPERLPQNIYGTEGEWETYSTPSRDARLKTAFKELRDFQRFVECTARSDPNSLQGQRSRADLLRDLRPKAAQCTITYTRSDGSHVTLGYEEARRRLFAISFDPYQCVERRWGARTGEESATCRETAQSRLVRRRAKSAQPDRPHLRRRDGFHPRRVENAGAGKRHHRSARRGCAWLSGGSSRGPQTASSR